MPPLRLRPESWQDQIAITALRRAPNATFQRARSGRLGDRHEPPSFLDAKTLKILLISGMALAPGARCGAPRSSAPRSRRAPIAAGYQRRRPEASGRGFCPSCLGRRMCQAAANLVSKPQWVVATSARVVA
jgi:hypothetical protein